MCPIESGNCNVAFYDSSAFTCWLGTIGSTQTLLAPQYRDMAGYVDTGQRPVL
jgi:hypothetical protein